MSIRDILQNSKVFASASLILLVIAGVGVFRLIKIEEGREPVLVENDESLENEELGPTSSRPVWHADPVKKSTKTAPKAKPKTKKKKAKKPYNKVAKM